eukprot:m.46965 g.46965  ORF g.46965 m.46965 type:complete len:894 (+) comp5948_c0_seq1:48-2729(+)
MGVTHLWRILERVERPCDMRDHAGTVVAVDISIWIHQLLHGTHATEAGQNAYLIGIFNRVVQLLRHQIKPIFVFDGSAPGLKKVALVNRRKRREENEELLSHARIKMLAVHARNSLFGTAEPAPLPTIVRRGDKPDMYELPAKPAEPQPVSEELTELVEGDEDLDRFAPEPAAPAHDEGPLEPPANVDDVFSAEFDALPLHMQSEMLEELLARQKKGTWRPRALNADDFSLQQIASVVKRNRVYEKLLAVREAILVAQSDGGPAMRALASDNKTVFFLERQSSSAPSLSRVMSAISGGGARTAARTDDPPELAAARRRAALLTRVSVATEDEDGDLSFDEANIDEANTDEAPPVAAKAAAVEAAEALMVAETSFPAARKAGGTAALVSAETVVIEDASPSSRSGLGSKAVSLADTVIIDDALVEDSAAPPAVSSRNTHMDLAAPAEESEPRPMVVRAQRANELAAASPNPEAARELPAAAEVQVGAEIPTPILPALAEALAAPPELVAQPSFAEVLAAAEAPAPAAPLPALAGTSQESAALQTNDDDDMVVADMAVTVTDDSGLVDAAAAPAAAEAAPDVPTDVQTDEDLFDDDLAFHDELQLNERITRLGENQQALADLAASASRAAAGINSENVAEVQELLQLMGVPFVVAPQEAESQCAAFEASGIATGIITDDSDVFLFGGRRVYRNVFSRQRECSVVLMEDVERLLEYDRDALVRMALLLGCDYTPGVYGVGPVYAATIMRAFPGPTGLEDFRAWVLEELDRPVGGLPRGLRNPAVLPKHFPDRRIIDAFAQPTVDECPECTWGAPDLPLLRAFACAKFGWDPARVDDAIMPLLRLPALPSGPARQLSLLSMLRPPPSPEKKDPKGKRKKSASKSASKTASKVAKKSS